MNEEMREKVRKIFLYTAPLILFSYLIYNMIPHFYAGNYDLRIENNEKVISDFESFKKESSPHLSNKEFKLGRSIPITPFVSFEVTYYGSVDSETGKQKYRLSAHRSVLLWDNIYIYIVSGLTIYIVFLSIFTRNIVVRNESSEKEIQLNTLEVIFTQDLADSEISVNKLRSSSSSLLFSGIALAILGVSVFYFSTPNINDYEIESILPIVRSVGVLIFIESIAWFLLKQYRNAIDDYKQFYRNHVQRKNYFIAYNLCKENESQELTSKLTERLLSENSIEKLQDGETTESIELRKIKENRESNFQTFIDLLSKNPAKEKI